VMAHFVKDKVHDKQDIPRPTFQTEQDFLNQGGGAPRK
jgi:hypothetical protein